MHVGVEVSSMVTLQKEHRTSVSTYLQSDKSTEIWELSTTLIRLTWQGINRTRWPWSLPTSFEH